VLAYLGCPGKESYKWECGRWVLLCRGEIVHVLFVAADEDETRDSCYVTDAANITTFRSEAT